MFEVSSCFIGKFKVGDNINHNCRILELLYRHYESSTESEKKLLCKPITITIISIIEAMLYDFHFRVYTFTREGIKNLTGEILNYIRDKKVDKLEKYISSAKKHDLFDEKDSDFYEALDELRKLRNRIHIQNEKNHFEADEIDAFCAERKEQAELVLEKVAKTLAQKHSRGKSFHHCENFKFPWGERFSE